MRAIAHREIAGTILDPTLPKTPVVVGGKKYDLCFDLGALAEAETSMNAELERAGSSMRINLLNEIGTLNFSSTLKLFAASLRVFHPDIPYIEALMLPTHADIFVIAEAAVNTWKIGILMGGENHQMSIQ